ncbi:MAG TPA: hypothetical protein VNK43_02030 [Gemmatimonadales bacterium]|nr:hypothetical protein [Gemmatimonadales bacterium]
MRFAALLAALLACRAVPLEAQRISVEAFAGTALNLPTPLRIAQAGEADLDFTARYRTRPFHESPYYALRLGFWGDGGTGWLLDFVHHKLYLDNPPAEVQNFEITHGFNLLAASRAWRRGAMVYAVGAGVVITHHENVVRGRASEGGGPFGGGYRLGGGTVMGTVGRRFPLVAALFLSADLRASLSYAEVPVAGGKARVPNVAAHLHAGLGYQF